MDLKGYVRIFYPQHNEWLVQKVYLQLIRVREKLIWKIEIPDDIDPADYTIHISDFHSIDGMRNWEACFTYDDYDLNEIWTETNDWHLPFEEHHLSRCWGRV